MAGKRLQLLKETIPKLSLVAVLWQPGNLGSEQLWKESQLAAPGLGLQLYSMEVTNADQFEGAFQKATKAGSAALAVTLSDLINRNRKRIAELAIKYRLPAMNSDSQWPAGLSFDAMPDGEIGRLRVYFRSGAVKSDWLGKWYDFVHRDFQQPAIRRFLDAFPWDGPEPYPDSAFIVCLEFHPAKSAVTLKTDMSVNQWMASDFDLVKRIRWLSFMLGLDASAYQSTLKSIGAWPPNRQSCRTHRFVGLGLEPDLSVNLTVYLEPPLDHKVKNSAGIAGAALTRHAQIRVNDPVRKAVKFLISKFQDGYWHDFDLPVGISDSWTTAYVLFHLSEAPGDALTPAAGKMIETSLKWLLSNRTGGSGWGYHTGIEPDADTTGLAVSALRRFTRPVPNEAVLFLEKCRRADGGVGTYPANHQMSGAWTKSVCDVTPMALIGLGDRLPAPEIVKAGRFLEQRQRADGLWPSYWWISPLYATWVSSTWLKLYVGIPNAGKLLETLRGYPPMDAFEQALRLLCLAEYEDIGPIILPHIDELIGEQRDDGSYRCRSARCRGRQPQPAQRRGQ